MHIATVASNVEEIAAAWAPEMNRRLHRKALDARDFALLADAGFTLTGVAADMGGVWESAGRAARPTSHILRKLARVDPSVALVATMHPTVLGFWLEQTPGAPGDRAVWLRQRERVLTAARDGAWFGTVVSEPGGGGAMEAVRAVAARAEDGSWGISGEKHMGSGSGITSYMLTAAVPEGETAADFFLIDARDLAWDGSRGVTLVREWDGHGMAATQSHAFRLAGLTAERHAELAGVAAVVGRTTPVLGYYCASVTMGVLVAAVAEARRRLQPRAGSMSAFERVAWTEAVNDIWLADQALEGMARALETGTSPASIPRGKLAIAELAEAALLAMSKAIGGASYSRSNPFGQWSQDVRALGFLRPPWALAHDRLFEASFAD